jgi:hypothetical protein
MVPRHIMSAALAAHWWNATSFADPEYVMDFKSPNAFCASSIAVFASCATARTGVGTEADRNYSKFFHHR